MNVAATQEPLPATPDDGAGQESLCQRYRRADLHDRLCLWLQFRDARQELDDLEPLVPSLYQEHPGRVKRAMGLPRL